MARTTPIFSSFTAGELSGKLNGRTDVKTYYQGCSELTNMIVWAHGGATKRQGTKYIATASGSATAVRVLPFEYSTEQTYILELGNQYMRFYRDGGQIQSGGSPYQITTPYLAADLASLRYIQSADTMYIVHSDYAPRKLTRTGHTSWTLVAVDNVNGPFLDENTTATTLTPSATTGSITLTASTAIFDDPGHVGADFKISGAEVVTAAIAAGNTFSSTLQLDRGETATFSLTGTWVAIVRLQKSLDSGANWIDLVSYTTNGSTSITETRDGSLYRVGVKTGDYTSGTVDASISNINQFGYATIDSVTNSTTALATVVRDYPSTGATTKWAEGAWSTYQGFPSSIVFYEQRLLFGGSSLRPQTVWGSEVDDYENFRTGIADSNAYTYVIAGSEVNNIDWMIDKNILYIGTIGGEWKFGNVDSATTPTNVNVKKQTSNGTANIQAISIGHTILYVQRGGKKLRTTAYDYRIDSWRSPDISIRSEHLLDNGIVELTYASKPDPIVWMVRNNGDLVGATYEPDQDVAAFHRHETQGSFESLAVINGTDGDEVWTVAKRNINGSDTRYIEQFQPSNWTDHADAYYMDSALTYSGSATTTISGLSHLEGETVSVLDDGATHPDVVVTSGVITLQKTTTKAIVGLSYTARLQTMDIETGAQAGTAQTKSRKIHKVGIRYYKSVGCNIGPDANTLDVMPFGTTSRQMDNKVPLYTGDKFADFPGGAAKTQKIMVTHSQPLPFSIISIIPVVSTSDH